MPRIAVLGPVFAGLLLAWGLEAAPDAAVVSWLRTRPSDKRVVVARLKERLAARDVESAYLLGRYLDQRLGVRSPKLYSLLGDCAARLGERDRARAFYDKALSLDPANARARSGLSGLGTDTATPSSPAASPVAGQPSEYTDALRYFHQDRYERALTAVERVLAQQPGHVPSRLLRARVLMAQQELDKAQAVLESLAREDPGVPEVYLRQAELLHGVNRCDHADALFEKALAVGPGDQLTLATYALCLYLRKEESRARPLFERARTLGPFKDRESVIAHAGIQLAKGQLEQCLGTIEEYNRTFGEDSTSLFVEGLILVRQGRKGEGAESIERSVRLNPQNLAQGLNVIPLLVTLGYPQKALQAVNAVDAAFPGNPRLREMREMIVARTVTDRDMVTRKEAPFELQYPRQLETARGEPIKVILGDFQRAQGTVGKLFGFRPRRVQIDVHVVSGIDNPAFYRVQEDAITITAIYFMKFDNPQQLALTEEQLRRFSSHMVAHEYAHMAFSHAVGYERIRSSKHPLPGWLDEGIAEWASGGIDTLPKTAGELIALFKDGFLDTERMQKAISVLNAVKTARDNLKAYVQSFYIVKYLMERIPNRGRAIGTFVSFCRELIGTGDLSAGLGRHYALTPVQFDEGWRDQIRKDLIEADTPRLTSSDARPVASAPGHGGIEVRPGVTRP